MVTSTMCRECESKRSPKYTAHDAHNRTMCLLVQRPFFHCGGYVCPDLEEKLLPRRELHDDARAWAASPRTSGVWRDVPASCHSVSLSLRSLRSQKSPYCDHQIRNRLMSADVRLGHATTTAIRRERTKSCARACLVLILLALFKGCECPHYE